MNSPAIHRIRPFSKKWYRVLLYLLAIVMALRVGIPEAQKVHAAPAMDTFCSVNNGCPVYPPPDLLYLSGTYAATPAQAASLKNLENQAISDLIKGHGLSPDDADAVKSWARNEALGELYALLVQAISASPRSTDQQNAVDWLTAIAQRQNIAAAEAAGREYVKWAGLDRSTYESLLRNNASQSDLESFLSGMPVNYNNTNTSLATGGWCVYRSPAPYGSEYTGYQDTVCYAPSSIIKLPPTPSYDQFVKWGQAKANYPLLSNYSYISTANSIALGLGIGLPLGAVAVGTLEAIAVAATYANYLAAAAEEVSTVATASSFISSMVSFTAVAGAGVATVVIAALTTAIILGINVTDAANLPGKLATLIVQARTTLPDVSTLVSSTSGGTSLFSMFVGAATPAPLNQTCDNSIFDGGLVSPPGWYPLVQVGTDEVTLTGIAPCLNPTDIPEASATDPQFVVTAKDSTTQTAAPSITWKDTATGSTTTARLHGNWFITQANGATAQALHITYTDWDGKTQNAWLIENPTDGYEFLTYSAPTDSSTTLDPKTCAAQGYCGADPSIKYIGADGQKYSATVRGYKAPTGTPTYSSAVEASPVTFNANDFAPRYATLPITYQWSFEKAECVFTLNCHWDTASGATASYTWQSGGTFHVDLTATDATGQQATTRLQVNVAGVPPTLNLAPDCSVNATAPCNTSTVDAGSVMTLKGTVGHTGSLDNIEVIVNWGDGGEDWTWVGPSITAPNPNLTLTPSPWPFGSPWPIGSPTLTGTHTYAHPGIYYATVTVANLIQTGVGFSPIGGTASQTFAMTVKGTQAITFPPVGGHSYGDVFSISATGGESGQPVTFAVTSSPPACTLSNVSGGAGTGSATVTVTSAGYCDITASQAGTAIYYPAPSVRQRVFTLLAVLTVTASSPTITYGEPVPAITPSYSGFVNGDTTSVLTAPATCAAAPNGGAAGTYATTCSGAAAPNYSTKYVPGTLTIKPAPLTITANNKTMTYGGTVPSFDAQYSGLLNGDTSGVVSGLTCVARDAAGQAVSSSTPAGSYPITCSGGSAANYSLSYVAGTLTINKAGTSTALSSSPSPSVYGQPVTFTASVSVNNPGSGHPGGTVAFKDGGNNIAGCAARPVDTATGMATCTTTALSVAQHNVSATYSGDSNFTGSSTAAALTQTVNRAAVTTTLGASANPSTAGQPVTFSATVAAAAPGAGIPTGSVTFKDGTTTLSTGTLSTSNGKTVASFTASGLSVGQHTITASYSGDGNFLAGAGATLTQYVNTNLSGYPKLPSGAYNLSNLNLTGGYFVNAPLAGASLSGTNLTSAVFLGANLTVANLSNSNLTGANLTGANLTGANLSNSNLTGANLTGANLTGANLTGLP